MIFAALARILSAQGPTAVLVWIVAAHVTISTFILWIVVMLRRAVKHSDREWKMTAKKLQSPQKDSHTSPLQSKPDRTGQHNKSDSFVQHCATCRSKVEKLGLRWDSVLELKEETVLESLLHRSGLRPQDRLQVILVAATARDRQVSKGS